MAQYKEMSLDRHRHSRIVALHYFCEKLLLYIGHKLAAERQQALRKPTCGHSAGYQPVAQVVIQYSAERRAVNRLAAQ